VVSLYPIEIDLLGDSRSAVFSIMFEFYENLNGGRHGGLF
jgi:hypothetical protein